MCVSICIKFRRRKHLVQTQLSFLRWHKTIAFLSMTFLWIIFIAQISTVSFIYTSTNNIHFHCAIKLFHVKYALIRQKAFLEIWNAIRMNQIRIFTAAYILMNTCNGNNNAFPQIPNSVHTNTCMNLFLASDRKSIYSLP